MDTLKLKTHIGSDGLLKFETPLNVADVDVEVVIVYTVQPKANEESWEDFVNATYGILADDPIERPEELPPDVRDEIE